MKNIKNYNCIVFSVNNFKKTLFENYKKNFEYTNLNFFFSEKKEFIFLHFNIDNYLKNKNIFISFLNDNEIYFNIVAIKYKNNYYDLNFFEELFTSLDYFLLEDLLINFLYVCFIKKLSNNKIVLFLFLKIFVDFNNLIKCQLYTKQLQK